MQSALDSALTVTFIWLEMDASVPSMMCLSALSQSFESMIGICLPLRRPTARCSDSVAACRPNLWLLGELRVTALPTAWRGSRKNPFYPSLERMQLPVYCSSAK